MTQTTVLKDELCTFSKITRAIIETESMVVDLGGLHTMNIFITPEGHLRMIDTDSVFPATERGKESNAAIRAKRFLDSLDRMSENL